MQFPLQQNQLGAHRTNLYYLPKGLFFSNNSWKKCGMYTIVNYMSIDVDAVTHLVGSAMKPSGNANSKVQ
jgi:hypothetical protein